MGPIQGQQDPGGPHVGPMNLTIWIDILVAGIEEYKYFKSAVSPVEF